MSDSRSIEILQATPDQAELAAELLHATGPPIFDYLYGSEPAFRTRMMALQWQAEEGFLSHRHAMAAYGPGGDMLGLELGFDNTVEDAAFEAASAIVQAHATAAQTAQIFAAARNLVYLTPFTPVGNYCVHNLAVTNTDRGTGLGRRLLEGAFERAAKSGYKSVCLDVMEINPAVGFYRHLGMRLACETRIPDLVEHHGFPTIYRMVRDV